MRTATATIIAILLVGCASTRPEPVDGERCDRVASLAADGELKPAVDEMATLEKQGIDCPQDVLVPVEKARARLAEADTLVLSAQAKRQQGDLRGATSDLERALEVYPKYFWAEKQLRDVQQALSADQPEAQFLARLFDAKLSQSQEAEARGDLTGASRLTSELLDSPPSDPKSRRDLIEYSRLLGLKLFSEGELTKARDLWRQTLAIAPSNREIRDYLEEVDQRLRALEEIKSKDDG